jgi:hypothetical protein
VRRSVLVSVVFVLVGMMLFRIYTIVRADVSLNAGKLLITEVSFNDANNDWVELYVVDGSVDWSDYRFFEGATQKVSFESAGASFATGDYIILHEETGTDDTNKDENNPGYWDFYGMSDLDATDRLLQIKEPSGSTKRVDVVIYSNNNYSFTSSVVEANDAVADGMWDSYTFCYTSCDPGTGDAGAWTDSDSVESSETIARYLDPGSPVYADSDSKINWYHEAWPSKGGANSQTVITLASFTATAHDGYVLVEWETASEIDNAGFNLWRSETEAGSYTKLNADLIPAQGEPTTGASYSYVDDAVMHGVTYWYKLEAVDIYGTSTFHRPVSATGWRLHKIYLPLLLGPGHP